MASLLLAYLLWLPPLGIIGAHHLYLRRPYMALLYALTFGLFGLGWLIDGVRMVYLLDRANHPGSYQRYSLFTAYQLLVPPMGMLGMHRFYLDQVQTGLVYAITGGLWLFGLVADAIELPRIVREANRKYYQLMQQQEENDASTRDNESDCVTEAGISETGRGLPLCVVCMHRAIDTVMLDCGHSCFCFDCAREFVTFNATRHSDGDGGDRQQPLKLAPSVIGRSLFPVSGSRLPCAICRADVREIKRFFLQDTER